MSLRLQLLHWTGRVTQILFKVLGARPGDCCKRHGHHEIEIGSCLCPWTRQQGDRPLRFSGTHGDLAPRKFFQDADDPTDSNVCVPSPVPPPWPSWPCTSLALQHNPARLSFLVFLPIQSILTSPTQFILLNFHCLSDSPNSSRWHSRLCPICLDCGLPTGSGNPEGGWEEDSHYLLIYYVLCYALHMWSSLTLPTVLW